MFINFLLMNGGDLICLEKTKQDRQKVVKDQGMVVVVVKDVPLVEELELRREVEKASAKEVFLSYLFILLIERR